MGVTDPLPKRIQNLFPKTELVSDCWVAQKSRDGKILEENHHNNLHSKSISSYTQIRAFLHLHQRLSLCRWRSIQGPTPERCVKRLERSALNWTSTSELPPPMNHCTEDDTKRLLEPEVIDICSESISARYHNSVVHMNSQGPISSQQRSEEMFIKLHPHLRSHWELVGVEEGSVYQ